MHMIHAVFVEIQIIKILKEEILMLKCNMCESGIMEHKAILKETGEVEENFLHDDGTGKYTHVYICDNCPNISFEYYDESDLETLYKFIKKQ